MIAIDGKVVGFKAGTEMGRGYLAVPDAPKGGVLVLHAWWGLNEFFRSFCNKLADHGFVAFCPDLHRGEVASTVEEAKALMLKMDNAESRARVTGAADYLLSQPAIQHRKIGLVGFSMGGGWALWLSTERPSEVAAVVVFYGTEGGISDFTKSQASYLGHYAEHDEWEPIDGVRDLEKSIRAAGRDAEFHFYPTAGHWFFEDNRPKDYKADAAGLAWTRTLDFLNSKLG